MTAEERERIKHLAYEVKISQVLIRDGDFEYSFSVESRALIARCLEIVAGAKVEEGYMFDGRFYSASDFSGKTVSECARVEPAVRCTFTEILTKD